MYIYIYMYLAQSKNFVFRATVNVFGLTGALACMHVKRF